jgi:triacylglycerol lipase
MPISYTKRKVRRLSRKVRNWSTVAKLTLQGNKMPNSAKLKNTKNPILVIYGFGATRRTMLILERRLQQEGYVTFSLNLGGFIGTFNTVSIEESAKYIDKKVEQLYKKNKIKGKMYIVGHSKGGLIGSYYIKFLNGARRVKTFITMGTPYNGSLWSYLTFIPPVSAVCKSLKQLKPDSAFIKKLRNTPFPKHIKVFSIYSKGDNACHFPTSVLKEAPHVKNVEVFGMSHSELLIKKSAFYAIRHGLKDEMPQSWIEASRKSYRNYLKKKQPTTKQR